MFMRTRKLAIFKFLRGARVCAKVCGSFAEALRLCTYSEKLAFDDGFAVDIYKWSPMIMKTRARGEK